MADIADYNHEPTIDPRRLRLRPNRAATEPDVPEHAAEEIVDPYGVGADALTAVDESTVPAAIPSVAQVVPHRVV